MPEPFKILLIDDDEDDREFFMIALEDLPLKTNCHSAASFADAHKLLHESDIFPHVIFLDLNMPIMDGRACLKELKQDPHTEKIPIVIFSTSGEQRDVIETKKLGAADFMTKPTDLTKLTEYINNFLITQL